MVTEMNPYKYSMDLSSYFEEKQEEKALPETGIMKRNVSRAAATEEPEQETYDPYGFLGDFSKKFKMAFADEGTALNFLGKKEGARPEAERTSEVQGYIKTLTQRNAIEDTLAALNLPEYPQDMPSAGTLGPLEGTQTLPSAPPVSTSPLGPKLDTPELDIDPINIPGEDSGIDSYSPPSDLEAFDSFLESVFTMSEEDKTTPEQPKEQLKGKGLMSKAQDAEEVAVDTDQSYEYTPDSLGMIGGVKDDENVWQSFDGSGQAHDATYKDYSQLFREYTFEEKEGYIPVGKQNGRIVYAAPDYAKDKDGNYISVNKNEATAMAKQMGGIVPTRDMVKSLYSQAVRIPMPTQPIGSDGGTGDSALYTQQVNEAIQGRGVEEGAVIAHGKEFFTDAQPTQAQRIMSKKLDGKDGDLDFDQDFTNNFVELMGEREGTEDHTASEGQFTYAYGILPATARSLGVNPESYSNRKDFAKAVYGRMHQNAKEDYGDVFANMNGKDQQSVMSLYINLGRLPSGVVTALSGEEKDFASAADSLKGVIHYTNTNTRYSSKGLSKRRAQEYNSLMEGREGFRRVTTVAVEGNQRNPEYVWYDENNEEVKRFASRHPLSPDNSMSPIAVSN